MTPDERPPRWLTVGRRRSDRWAAWAVVVVAVVCAASAVRTSYRADQLQDRLDSYQVCRRFP